MRKCKRCEGIIQTESPRKIVDGDVYHLHCGFKVEKEKTDQLGKEVVQSPQQA